MIRLALLLAVFLVPPQEVTEKQKRDFVDKNVDKAIEKGLRALRESQGPNGSFEAGHTHGVTALALYTLLALGGTLEDPAAAKALDWLLNNPVNWTGGGSTYQISLVAVALSYCMPHLPRGEQRERATAMLQQAADWLASAQEPGGGWGYGQKSNGWHDHSNSQFAVLGLRAAANEGARIKKEVWEREYTHYKTSQQQDGGWGYRVCYQARSRRGGTTSTMTAAGVMGLAMTIGTLTKTRPESLAADPAIKKGLQAMSRHWSEGLTNNLKDLGGVPYLLYSIERACMLTGQRLLGSIDWYVEGAWLILNEQSSDGTLGIKSSPGNVPLASHCFCLLFLKRAFIPVATPSNPKPRPVPTSDPNAGKPREME